MVDPSVNIVIGGEAGQGLATIGLLAAQALVRSGYDINVTQDYQSRIRGGHNTFAIRLSPEAVHGPKEHIDVLLALDQATVDLHVAQLSERGVLVCDQAMDPRDAARVFKVPYKDLAPQKLFYNTVALGIIAAIACLDAGIPRALLAEAFHKKGDEVVARNQAVLDAAYVWTRDHDVRVECPAPAMGSNGRLCMTGNDCLALGAMAAGVNFCSYYPMTPASSIPQALVTHSQEMGVVVEQAEDEIAAIMMALGASYAGARAMTATSGGGFALMCEAVSLAGMTETPLVIALAMRPGPATGLPTRTEQGDLNLALFSGHGEFPRAIYAPGSHEECFHLTHKAFDLAERFQSPVFVLTDQYQADCYRAVTPFDLAGLPPVAEPLLAVEDPQDYQRYVVTASGVSPRLVPGVGPGLVVVDSDEHTPDGHITEDLEVRVAMVDKRNRKYDGLVAEVVPPAYNGPEFPDVLFVGWGSTKGAIHEAAAELRAQGRNAATLHFPQVWPLCPEQFLQYFRKARQVVLVEGNSTAQFRGILQVQSGFRVEQIILRYDGLPITAAYILQKYSQLY